MKRRILSILLCMVLALGLTSCRNQEPVPDSQEGVTERTEPIASFDSVKEFKIAIKKEPTLYDGKTVSVKGNAHILLSSVWLFDEIPGRDELWGDKPRVEVVITDSVVLVEEGDYIEICGIVKISSDGLYLRECTYTTISAYEEKE